MSRDLRKELLGRKFDYWKVVAFADNSDGSRWWWCVCECQRSKPNPTRHRKREDHLRKARTKSCGCFRSALMQGNRRAVSNKATVTPVSTPVESAESSSGPTQNEVWAAQALGTNLIGEGDSLPKCPHGVYLAKSDTAKYCQFCTPNDQTGGSRVSSRPWNKRIADENLRLDRGMAPSTNEPTSSKARTFTPTADKVWSAGKNLILSGGSSSLEETAAVREARWRMGGKKRSAAGRDVIKPWQNPNVDIEADVEAVGFRDTKCRFDNPNIPLESLDADEKRELERLEKLDREKEADPFVE
jgi:hypothetical protein